MCAYNRSSKEEDYFLKKETERMKAEAEEHAKETADAEKKRLKDLHYMKCPKCGMDMQEIEFRAVHIDKCFSCGGVYFDDGELEQIIKEEGNESFFGRFTGIFKG